MDRMEEQQFHQIVNVLGEYDYEGYNKPIDRSNQPPLSQKENYIEKKAAANRCCFFSIGLLIGSIVSGIIAFVLVKYSGIVLLYEGSSCFWTEWSNWKGCNNLLTSVMDRRVQIYTGHTGHAQNCQQREKFETRICKDRTLNIRFDPTTLRSDRYLSVDHTILSNRFTDRIPSNPGSKLGFQKYQGAMVNTCVENMTSIYFEISFKYYVISSLVDKNLIFELGIGERNKIDNYFDAGNSNVSGWAFQLHNCKIYKKVCLKARHEPLGIDVDVIKSFSNNTTGTTANGTFGILIDRERNKFSLFYNDTVLFTFYDVLSNVSLCPVFGVFNSDKVEVDLQIVSVGNMTLMV